MHAGDNICNDLADWTNNSNPNLAEAHVDFVNEECREGVAGEGAEEHAGHYGVVYVIVFLNLAPFVSTFCWADQRNRAQSLLRMEVKPVDSESV